MDNSNSTNDIIQDDTVISSRIGMELLINEDEARNTNTPVEFDGISVTMSDVWRFLNFNCDAALDEIFDMHNIVTGGFSIVRTTRILNDYNEIRLFSFFPNQLFTQLRSIMSHLLSTEVIRTVHSTPAFDQVVLIFHVSRNLEGYPAEEIFFRVQRFRNNPNYFPIFTNVVAGENDLVTQCVLCWKEYFGNCTLKPCNHSMFCAICLRGLITWACPICNNEIVEVEYL